LMFPDGLLDPALTRPLNPVLIYISVAIYLVYLLMYYALIVFKMLRAPGVDETLNIGAAKLISQSRRQRGPRND
jgi:hypothetical protein